MKYWIIKRLIKILKSYFGSLFCVFLYLDNPTLLFIAPINSVLFKNFIKSLLAFFVFKSCIVPICIVIPTSIRIEIIIQIYCPFNIVIRKFYFGSDFFNLITFSEFSFFYCTIVEKYGK